MIIESAVVMLNRECLFIILYKATGRGCPMQYIQLRALNEKIKIVFHTASMLVPGETRQTEGGKSPSRLLNFLIMMQPPPVSHCWRLLIRVLWIFSVPLSLPRVPALGCCQRLSLGVYPAPLPQLLACDAWQLLLRGLSGESTF